MAEEGKVQMNLGEYKKLIKKYKKTKRYMNDNARDKPPPAVGSIHRGAVKRIESYGAFVTLEGFSDGMVHVSQLSRSQRFYDARDIEQAFPLGGPIFVQVVFVYMSTTTVMGMSVAQSALMVLGALPTWIVPW